MSEALMSEANQRKIDSSVNNTRGLTVQNVSLLRVVNLRGARVRVD